MISTQRLIIILFMFSIIIGVLYNIFSDPYSFQTETLTGETAVAINYENSVDSETGIYGTIKGSQERQQEPHIMNPITGGLSVWRIAWAGLNPLSVSPSDFLTVFERAIAGLISIIRSALSVLLIIEFIMFLINKKTS